MAADDKPPPEPMDSSTRSFSTAKRLLARHGAARQFVIRK
jgi:hypothetical protein